MRDHDQSDMLSEVSEMAIVQGLLAELHDDLKERVSRTRQLLDISSTLGTNGTMIPGGEVAFGAWCEARASFVTGNFIATVLLCQAMAEQVLASYLAMLLDSEPIKNRIYFADTVKICEAKGIISAKDATDFKDLSNLRNPLSHHRHLSDKTNLGRRVIDDQISAHEQLRRDATFAIGVAVKLLSLSAFRLDGAPS